MHIAVIGLGGIARRAYLPVLGTRAELDLILVSRREATVREIQAEYRVAEGTTSLDEAIRLKPQAAFVLSPNETHFEIVRPLLEAGIDVFVEKPATLRSDETRQLAELADRRGRVLMVGFNRRYAPLHRKARELLGDGPVSFGLFRKDRAMTNHPSLEDQFTDDTIHQIDVLRYYCGEGEVVSTACQLRDGRLLSAISTVALERGGIASVVTSLNAGAWSETYHLTGGKTTLLVDAFLRVRRLTSEGEQSWEETYASSWKSTLEGRGFTGQIDHFLNCVQTRSQPETSAWDSVKTQLLLEAMVAKSSG